LTTSAARTAMRRSWPLTTDRPHALSVRARGRTCSRVFDSIVRRTRRNGDPCDRARRHANTACVTRPRPAKLGHDDHRMTPGSHGRAHTWKGAVAVFDRPCCVHVTVCVPVPGFVFPDVP